MQTETGRRPSPPTPTAQRGRADGPGAQRPLATALTAGAWGFLVLYCLWRLGPGAGLPRHSVAGELLYLPVFVLPSVAGVLAARARQGRAATAWWLIAGAWIVSVAGALLWLVGRAPNVPPSITTLGTITYNVYYPCLVAGLALLVARSAGPGGRTRLVLEALIVVGACQTLLWYFVVHPVQSVEVLGSQLWSVGVTYVGETAVLFAASLVLHSSGPAGAEWPLRVLGVGTLGATIADLTGLRNDLVPSAAMTLLTDVLLAFSATIVTTAGAMAPAPPPRLLSRPLAELTVRVVGHLPFVSTGVVSGLLLYELRTIGAPGTPVRGLAVAATLLTGLIIVRAAIAQREVEAEALALQASERRYRDLFEQNPYPQWICEPDTLRIVAVNDAAVRSYGYARAQFESMTFRGLAEEPRAAEAAGGLAPADLTRHRTQGGAVMDVRVTSHTVPWSGRPALLLMAENVTERRRADQLQVEKEAAVAANRAKGEFLAAASHELRTPLNAIVGYTELLQEEAADVALTSFLPDLARIGGAARHLLAMINDLLDLSKIDAGRMPLHIEEFELHTLVEDAAGVALPLIEKNGNRLEIDVPPASGTMWADSVKTKQVLLNLLSNAAKFTSGGVVRVTLSRRRDTGLEWVDLRVEDTGVGMSPEQMSRVFDMFAQADASTHRHYGGTGLGLPISRRLCSLMGGDLIVQSRPGRGTTFTMRLPRDLRTVIGGPSEALPQAAAGRA